MAANFFNSTRGLLLKKFQLSRVSVNSILSIAVSLRANIKVLNLFSFMPVGCAISVMSGVDLVREISQAKREVQV